MQIRSKTTIIIKLYPNNIRLIEVWRITHKRVEP